MGHKPVETTHKIHNTFGPGTASECTVQWWFKKSCKGDESLEDEECSGWSLEVDSQLRAIIKTDPLKTTREVAEQLNINHSTVIQHLKQIGKVKTSMRGCLMSWLEIKKKKSLLWGNIFSYSTQKQQIISWLDCDMQQKVDFIQQPAMASSMVGLGRSSKEPVQTKLAPKRSHGPCLGGLLLVWSTTVFWILVEPLHLRSMLSKLIDEPKTSMPTGSIGQQKGPNSSAGQCLTACRTTSASKVEWLSFASSATFTLPLVNWLSFLQASQQLYAGKMLPQQQEVEHAFQECVESWSSDFYTAEINNKLTSYWQKCVDFNGSYFD